MRQIKFCGRADDGCIFCGDLINDDDRRLILTQDGGEFEVEPDSVGQLIGECKSGDLYDGDEIRIDYDGVAKVIGEGLMLRTLKATKPTEDAKLKVEYSYYRYRLIWRTHNGSVDTGIDMALLAPILPFVEVKEAV